MGIETSGHDHIKALLLWQLSALSPPDSQRWAKEESEMSVSRVRAMDKVVLIGGGGGCPYCDL